MSRVRRYSRSGLTAQPPRSPTGLSPPAVTRSSGLRLTDAGAARRLPPPPAHSSNPLLASPAGYRASRVWAPPRSLAATKGILSVPRGTEMFQFPRCPPELPQVPGRAPGGLPHSDIPGSLAASASPGHFAAWPRPSSAANAKASTMRPSCGYPASVPHRARRDRDSRPARASGTVPSGRSPVLLPHSRDASLGRGVCVLFAVCLRWYVTVRAGEQTQAPAPHRSPGVGQDSGRTSPRRVVILTTSGTLAHSRGRRTPRVPRGALSRC
jgi:hypothetical protein